MKPHNCKEMPEGYRVQQSPFKEDKGAWTVERYDEKDCHDFDIIGRIKFCPFCGKKL